jgi:citrate synthase
MSSLSSTQIATQRTQRVLAQLQFGLEKGLYSLENNNTAAAAAEASSNPPGGSRQSLTIIDNRTGKKYEFPIKHDTVEAIKFWDIKANPAGSGLRLYDPGFTNTASATSKICEIQGGKGILRYRGYPIEQLAEKSTFLEVSFLLLYGELPDAEQLNYFTNRVMKHTYVHEDLKRLMGTFRYDAHPMGMVISTITAMSTFHPEANPALTTQDVYKDEKLRNKQVHRLLGTVPTISAFAYRHRIGRPLVNPAGKNLSYCENFLYMLDKLSHVNYKPHPKLARALDVLFILHADHELNCR